MARIVYGVSGEGSGHASRAREVLGYLGSRGHDVRVVTYDRGLRDLGPDFDVFPVTGLHLAAGADNRVSTLRTVLENLAKVPDGVASVRRVRRLFREFRPDCVLCDFEPITAHLAWVRDVPLVTVDNQHRMRYMRSPCPPGRELESRVTRGVIRAMVPRPDFSIATTFYFGEVTNDRTLLVPPILRSEVRELAQRPRPEGAGGQPVLVYFTRGFERFLEALRAFPDVPFRVYGQGREGREGNLEFRAPSRVGFLEDLRDARAVIGTAGFTLITESLHLGKAYLALPMEGQFEQELNAHLLEASGWGCDGTGAGADELGAFLNKVPALEAQLAKRARTTDDDLRAALDRLLDDSASGAREAFDKRRADQRR